VFRAFFPYPKWFFLSALAWCALAVGLWLGAGFDSWEPALQWTAQYAQETVEGERPPFLSAEKLWTYIFVLFVGFSFPLMWLVHGSGTASSTT